MSYADDLKEELAVRREAITAELRRLDEEHRTQTAALREELARIDATLPVLAGRR